GLGEVTLAGTRVVARRRVGDHGWLGPVVAQVSEEGKRRGGGGGLSARPSPRQRDHPRPDQQGGGPAGHFSFSSSRWISSRKKVMSRLFRSFELTKQNGVTVRLRSKSVRSSSYCFHDLVSDSHSVAAGSLAESPNGLSPVMATF